MRWLAPVVLSRNRWVGFAFLASLALGGPASAEEGPAEDGLYVGTENHVKFGTGLGLGGNGTFSLTPTLEGRFALGEAFGVQVVLPFAAVFVDHGNLEGDSRLDIANPSVAFEVVLDRSGRGATVARGGVAFPLQNLPEDDGHLGTDARGLFERNSLFAIGTYGGFNLWRYMPESLSVFGDIAGAIEADDLLMELGAGLGLFIPTGDTTQPELAIQLSAKAGFGTTIMPFVGLGLVILPTGFGNGGDDVLLFGVQAGVAAKVGSARLDVGAQLNIAGPLGSSFDDGGIFGLDLGVTVPF